MYDDRAINDLAVQCGKYFGTKTRETSRAERYLLLFDLNDHVAYAVVDQDEKVIPVTMVQVHAWLEAGAPFQ